MKTRTLLALLVLSLVAWLTACDHRSVDIGGLSGTTTPPPTSVTQTISAASGGIISGPGGVTLEIPPGALASDTAITIALDANGAPPVPDALTPLAPMVALLPHGTTFGVPVRLSLPLPAGAATAEIATTNAQGDGWEALETTLEAGRPTAALTHFSRVIVYGVVPGAALRIIGEPRDSFAVPEGGFWIFHVDAVGNGPLSYAWMRNGVFLANETNRDIMINPVRAGDDGALYSVRVTGAGGASLTSRAARLTVTIAPPRIVNEPRDAQVVTGSNATFVAASTSSIAQTVQWKRCPAASSCPPDPAAWLDIAGATATTLTIATQPGDDGNRYAMCASNASGTTCSRAALLTVQPLPVQPVVTAQPQPVSTAAGTSASFTVTASGGALVYQWQSGRDGVNFTPEARCIDSATCTLSNVTLGDDGLRLRVRVSNPAGAAISNSALLTVRLVSGVALARVGGGINSSIGLRADGRLVEWGRQVAGVGVGTPRVLSDPFDVATLAAGNTHRLAIRANGELFAWGSNTNGQLGNGSGSDQPAPQRVSGLAAVRSAAAGVGAPQFQSRDNSRYSLAVEAANGLVFAWGTNLSGQLGTGTTVEQQRPVAVGRISGVTGVAAGGGHVLARRSDGSVWVWGRNTSGQLGTGQPAASLRPVPIALTDIVAVAAGDDFSIALRGDGTVLTWGSGASGRLGSGAFASRDQPTAIALPAPAIAIASGNEHALALLLDGRVFAWGRNDRGQLGTGSIAFFDATPRAVVAPLPANVVAIGAGLTHSLALDADGNVWGWGANDQFQLSDGTNADRFTPVQAQGVNLN